jgi:hypothetical protein
LREGSIHWESGLRKSIGKLRAFLLERGLVTGTGRQHLLKELPALLGEAEQQLSPSLFRLLGMLVAEWRQIEATLINSTATSSESLTQMLRADAF